MERLYFDLFYRNTFARDDEGADFASLEAARHSAIQSLLEIARGGRLSRDATELKFVVRDQRDREAFTARLLVLVTP